MSLSRRIAALCAAAAFCLLSACGFQPLHGGAFNDSGSISAHYAEVDIASIPDRDGQYLRNQLIDRLYLQGRPDDARYELRIRPLKLQTTGTGIRKDATATRNQLQADATVQLVEKASGAVVLKRDLHAVGAYNVLDNQFATLISRQSLTEHVLQELADSIVTELNLHFRRAADAQ